MADSISIVEEAKEKLIKINGEMGKIKKIKFESVLLKNKGYQEVFKISDILNGKKEDTDGLPEDLNLNDLTYFKSCPITSVENVENVRSQCTRTCLLQIDVLLCSKISKNH